MAYPPYNADDDLIGATEADRQSHLRVYSPRELMVVLGRGSRAEAEVNLEACDRDRVPIYRRRGGGCTVVLDPGNVVVSTTLPVEGLGKNDVYMKQLCAWLIAGLGKAGVQSLQHAGISDVALEGRKLAGSCIYRTRATLFFSATILVEPDLSRISQYLKHPPREPNYRVGRSHAAFLTALTSSVQITAAEVRTALDRVLSPPTLR